MNVNPAMQAAFEGMDKVLADYKRGLVTPTEFFAELSMHVNEVENQRNDYFIETMGL